MWLPCKEWGKIPHSLDIKKRTFFVKKRYVFCFPNCFFYSVLTYLTYYKLYPKLGFVNHGLYLSMVLVPKIRDKPVLSRILAINMLPAKDAISVTAA